MINLPNSPFSKLILFSLSLMLVFNARGEESSAVYSTPRLQKMIKDSKLPESSLSLYAELYPSGQSLISVNAAKLLNPASVSKLVTAATALTEYPTDHRFKTKVLINGSVEGSTLKGDIILQGGGDPAFVSESMWKLVNQFLRTGIKKVTGQIIVDDTAFDSVRFGESRREKRVDRAYDAPVGAMSFNWNSVNIFVRTGNKVGEPAQVWLDPANEYLTLVNKATTSKGVGSSVAASRVSTENGDKITVTGNLGISSDEKVIYKSITKPALWSGYNFKAFLSRRGIEVAGSVKVAPAPATAKMVAFEESKNISSLVSDMNKFSNNYVAEMLIKNLAAKNGAPASLSEGTKRIQEYLIKTGLGKDKMVINSPSGLSNENRMSSAATVDLLRNVRKDFRVFPEYITSLPIAGIDGTLKNRFKQNNATGWVRAKTGYLSGSVALAGYGGRKDGQMLIFSFIHNGKGNAWETRKLFDDLAEVLVFHTPAPGE